MSLLATESMLEARGWDADPVVLALRLGEEGDRLPIEGAGQIGLLYQTLGTGDPYGVLGSAEAPGATAVVVAAEAWAFPSDLPRDQWVGRPSDHPGRVEVRSFLAVTRSGEVLHITRVRGQEPMFEPGSEGPLVDAMRAVLTRKPKR